MNDTAAWQEGNAQYLAAALAWLRLLLERRAGREPSSLSLHKAPEAGQPVSLVKRLMGRSGPVAPHPSTVHLLPSPAVDASHVTMAANKFAAAEAGMDPPPALAMLSRRLGLSRFERDVLLLCAAVELDTRIAALCARAQNNPNLPHPTFALALSLFDEPAWDVLSPERPLRYFRMIEISQQGAQPLTTSPLRADERIVSYLKGLNCLDDRLASLVMPFEVDRGQGELPASQQAVVSEILRRWCQAATASLLPVVQLVGPDSTSKQLIACRAAAELALQVYRLPAALIPSNVTDVETLARLWERESVLLPVALYVDAHEADGAPSGEGQLLPVHRFLTRAYGVFFLATRDVWVGLDRPAMTMDVARSTPAEQRAVWAAALGEMAPDNLSLLAGQFNLTLPVIRKIVQDVMADNAADEESLTQRLWDACRAAVRPRLDILAQRLEPKVTWEDIVLPAGQTAALRQLAAQVSQRGKVYQEWGFAHKMNRGMGVNALFAGDSGTGKTMAAEVIANHLRLDLYRIDLSAVVNKFIGETEKNLRRLFDAAEDGGAILFFDEADALFGKRTEVKDSHDRYANIEINYLLQRMEAYRGLAILATNMRSALDAAFVRRLRFIITFPFPGPEDRKRIWQKAFPPQTPMGPLDYGRLANLNLTGGSIHNIALNAAFLAADSDTPVTMPLVLSAVRAEFLKMDRPINEADFRWLEKAAGTT